MLHDALISPSATARCSDSAPVAARICACVRRSDWGRPFPLPGLQRDRRAESPRSVSLQPCPGLAHFPETRTRTPRRPRSRPHGSASLICSNIWSNPKVVSFTVSSHRSHAMWALLVFLRAATLQPGRLVDEAPRKGP